MLCRCQAVVESVCALLTIFLVAILLCWSALVVALVILQPLFLGCTNLGYFSIQHEYTLDFGHIFAGAFYN